MCTPGKKAPSQWIRNRAAGLIRARAGVGRVAIMILAHLLLSTAHVNCKVVRVCTRLGTHKTTGEYQASRASSNNT
jgi:hypothetical protein